MDSGSDSPVTSEPPNSSTWAPTVSSLSSANTSASKATRKTHSKTRTGCGICKKRKIKCDETRPSCRNCVKRSVECDLTPSLASHGATVGPDPPISLIDLELLNNFTSSTYSTLTGDPTTRNIWRTAVVRKATGCEFVMRTVLAVSGMHIAQYRPEQKHLYISHAMAHHKAAGRIAIGLMAELLPQHQEDLWIFSVLTIYFALGSPKDASASLLIGESVLPDWILLLNGVRHLLSALQPASYSGILSPILKNGARRWQASHESEHRDASILHDLSVSVRSTVTDPEELEIYEKAIDELCCQIGLVLSFERRDLDIMDAFVWHFVTADSFMPLLKQMKQEAVAIFAHSLIILNAFEGHRWLHGWDTFLMSRIWDILDEEHRLWIQWPIEEIGWVPPPTHLV